MHWYDLTKKLNPRIWRSKRLFSILPYYSTIQLKIT